MDTKNLKKLRIYIVDDHKLFREGLKLLLSTQISYTIFTKLPVDATLLKTSPL